MKTASVMATEDYKDVSAVADQIGIPYYSVNFEKSTGTAFSSIPSGNTVQDARPIQMLCAIRKSSLRPFGLCHDLGADYVATGHYAEWRVMKMVLFIRFVAWTMARIRPISSANFRKNNFKNHVSHWDIWKPEVRRLAEEAGLATAKKKDSTGICFIGEKNF